MNNAARYYIAQLTPDLFRREQTNVGIIVLKGNDIAAKFTGERRVGELDRRQFKTMDAPDVYVQWVDYWRRLIRKPDLTEHDLLAANGGNFNVIPGGEVSDINGDSANNVVEYLFPLLVSDGGLIEALGQRETAEGLPDTSLKRIISHAFRAAEILDSGSEQIHLPPHPVRKEAPVAGKGGLIHNPAYSQDNGKLVVMETVDFSKRAKVYARDHAGYAAYVFRDIKEAHSKRETDAIAIVQLESADMNDSMVIYSMNILKKTADHIVNWAMTPERQAFLAKCVENAKGPPESHP